jgi:hypothetical protein
MFVVFTVTLLIGCSGAGGVITNSTESASKLNPAMMADFPLPKDTRVLTQNSLILGEGDAWVGRLELYAPLTPSDSVSFFIERYPQLGWTLLSSTKSKNSMLIFTNNKKTAAMEISEGSALSMASKITITVSPLNTNQSANKKK